MNIFADVIITTNSELKNLTVERLALEKSESNEFFEVFSLVGDDKNTILVYTKTEFLSQIIAHLKENYEILKLFSLGTAISLGDVDLELGDVMVPNTLINEQNEVLFLEGVIDNNYDLKKFGLILNGICYTRTTEFKNEDELLELQSDYVADILDSEAYILADILSQNDLLEKSCFIKVVGNEGIGLENGVDILELML